MMYEMDLMIIYVFQKESLYHKLKSHQNNYIELSINSTCEDLLAQMPVYYKKREKRMKFALCLQKGIFGYVSPEELIHF